MKRIGTIYSRDTSKSKQKINKLPLKDLDTNLNKNDRNQQRQNKRWRLQLDNVQDSQQKRTFKEQPKTVYENDKKEITFSDPRIQERSMGKSQEEDVTKKLECLNRIIKQIGTLKECELKESQEVKLMEIQDRLLEYQRKVIQKQKLNYQ